MQEPIGEYIYAPDIMYKCPKKDNVQIAKMCPNKTRYPFTFIIKMTEKYLQTMVKTLVKF